MREVFYDLVTSPLGPLVAAASEEGMLLLAYEHGRLPRLLDELAAVSPNVTEAPDRIDPFRAQLDEYFTGRRRSFDIPVDWRLSTGFTRKVLEAAARLPYGAVTTYAKLAEQVGSPRGARAVGNALGANPLAIVVPCHRVLRSGGGLGGYTTGVEKKQFLLDLEGVAL